jgi:serine/threonine protein kinase
MSEYLGKQFGNYRLVKLLGEGAFAQVYLGEHIHLGSQAAIKVLTTKLTKEAIEQFRDEARIIINLEHTNIVRVLDFDLQGRIPFIVTSYAPGGSLRKRHPIGSCLALTTIITYAKQIASALQYAHDRKLIHRDVKPDNMLIGRNDEILLSDFGIAVIAHSTHSLITDQFVSGTVYYMAPEQIQGKTQIASDQYALGIVVYEWLSGMPPFMGTATEIGMQHLLTPPPSLRDKLPTLSPEVERVVLKALAKDPKLRFENIQTFADTLADTQELELLVSLLTKEVVDRIVAGVKKATIATHDGQGNIIQRTQKIYSIQAIEARDLARDFLALRPFKDKKSLFENLQALGKKHKIAEQLYFEASKGLEEFKKRIAEVVAEEWLIAEKYNELGYK